ncbi:hypothetical protein [Paenibacillus radicis (ex Xue et al. 2023)]|uniref:Uncharacterized protein n=1 Tax=Paenibacillus radicis (ex Xue et al. 2023) TaxID=2972489 RepID=A0ABT1YU49_9BACL|nr:hypothetical protein [Paenibacillus radicis (ex Xue et al. 2023)]MCR8636712.1 hypothetical protein [Paenibacillus radicis (ex Xue et al. 2023)]
MNINNNKSPKKRRVILIGSYVFLTLWVLGTAISILNPIILYIWFLLCSTISLLLIIILLIPPRKRMSLEEKIIAIILILPLVLIVGVYLYSEIKSNYVLSHTQPSEELILKSLTDYGNERNLDLSYMEYHMAEYDTKNRHLTVNVKVHSELLINYLESSSGKAQEDPHRYIHMIREYYEFVNELYRHTTVPQTITVMGYWGDTFIYKGEYVIGNNHYRTISEPLKIVGREKQWFLKFYIDGTDREIFLRNSKNNENFGVYY